MNASFVLPGVVFIAMLIATPATAQPPPAASKAKEFHQKLLKSALESMAQALCGSNQPCAPATSAEIASPPITDKQVQSIVNAAIVSKTAEHCGLDWKQRNFLPLMSHYRRKIEMTERQMALVGLLHGITMGTVKTAVERADCSPELRASIEKRLIAQ